MYDSYPAGDYKLVVYGVNVDGDDEPLTWRFSVWGGDW
jgi:hypothetical protein